MSDDDDFLKPHFDAAERAAPVPTEALLSRIVSDAEAVRQSNSRREAPRRHSVFRAFGGWPALGGLITAAAAGVWIGAVQPLGFDPLEEIWYSSAELAVDDLGGGYDVLTWGDG